MDIKKFDETEITLEKERDFKQKKFKIALKAGKTDKLVLVDMDFLLFEETRSFPQDWECEVAMTRGYGFFIIEFLYPVDKEEKIRTGLKEFSQSYNFPIPF